MGLQNVHVTLLAVPQLSEVEGQGSEGQWSLLLIVDQAKWWRVRDFSVCFSLQHPYRFPHTPCQAGFYSQPQALGS